MASSGSWLVDLILQPGSSTKLVKGTVADKWLPISTRFVICHSTMTTVQGTMSKDKAATLILFYAIVNNLVYVSGSCHQHHPRSAAVSVGGACGMGAGIHPPLRFGISGDRVTGFSELVRSIPEPSTVPTYRAGIGPLSVDLCTPLEEARGEHPYRNVLVFTQPCAMRFIMEFNKVKLE
ncbi:unnamed protein product, partial [Discosporangium mesarthrocarpum]